MQQKWLTELGLFYESVGPAMVSMGKIVVETIRKRTKQGVDKTGNALAPYTKRYAQRKGSSNVNLTDTGKMLSAFGVSEGDRSRILADTRGRGSRFRVAETGQFAAMPENLQLKIVWNDSEQAKKGWAHETGKSPRWNAPHPRPWMGLSDLEAQEAFDHFGRNLRVIRSTKETVNVNITF